MTKINPKNTSENTKVQFFTIKRKRDIRNNILDLLRETQYGLNISQIAEQLNLSRNTVKNYLGRFEREGLIRVKEMGRAKMCFLNELLENDTKNLVQSLTPEFFKNFLTSFNDIGSKYIPNLQDFMKQIGKEMATLTFWPTRRLLAASVQKGEPFSLDQVVKIAMQYVDILKIFGTALHVDLKSTDRTPNDSKATLIIKDLRNFGFNNLYYFIWAGILETKLQEVFGEAVYLDIPDFQQETSSYNFELGIREKNYGDKVE